MSSRALDKSRVRVPIANDWRSGLEGDLPPRMNRTGAPLQERARDFALSCSAWQHPPSLALPGKQSPDQNFGRKLAGVSDGLSPELTTSNLRKSKARVRKHQGD